jgi:hypothetical protein
MSCLGMLWEMISVNFFFGVAVAVQIEKSLKHQQYGHKREGTHCFLLNGHGLNPLNLVVLHVDKV